MSIEELIDGEYDEMSWIEEARKETVVDKSSKTILEILKRNLTKAEYLTAESEIAAAFISVEKYAFEQGFLRGFTVAKGTDTYT